jgi:hypothetical protein
MPGFQEILIIAAIILGLVFIPRMMEPKKPAVRRVRAPKRLDGRWRLAIALSVIYPLVMAAVLQPWHGTAVGFLYFGLGPVLLAWLLLWVFQGFMRR